MSAKTTVRMTREQAISMIYAANYEAMDDEQIESLLETLYPDTGNNYQIVGYLPTGDEG